jgi:hypothetical protein
MRLNSLSMNKARITELRRRIKLAMQSLATFERIESELRSMSVGDDPVRLHDLMKANAEILNATKARLGSYQEELARLSDDSRSDSN